MRVKAGHVAGKGRKQLEGELCPPFALLCAENPVCVFYFYCSDSCASGNVVSLRCIGK